MEKVSGSHEWIRREGDVAVVGITKKACKELGEIVYAELPEVGSKINKGDEVVVLESTKAAIDICSPVSGEVVEVNDRLKNSIKILNEDSEGSGWLYKIR
jgi:glycine cleavage system H protein